MWDYPLKKGKKLAAVLLAVCMLAAGCGKAAPADAGFWQQPSLHEYHVDAVYDDEKKTVAGTLQVKYTNPAGKTLESIPFMLYPNAFRKVETAPFINEEMGQAYPKGFSPGGIEINQTKVNGQEAKTKLGNPDETLLEISLPRPLAPGETTEVFFAFTVQLPHCLGRFGYGEKTVNLCNFLPIACAWEDGAFLHHPYGAVGDPFVSDCSDYTVVLNVPEAMETAHTGERKEIKTENGRKQLTIQAGHVRDFAAVLSRSFAVDTYHVKSGGRRVTVRSYYEKECKQGGKLAGQAAKKAMETFGKMYGMYPYENFCVVQTDFFIGGMEYPGLVLLDQSLYTGQGLADLERVSVHETAHQWWYGVVGNDQVLQPWLDEALTDYSTLLFMGQTKGQEEEQTFYQTYVVLLSEIMNPLYARDQCKAKVNAPATAFRNNGLYSLVVYTEGTMMLRKIEQAVSREKMIQALAAYYQAYAGLRADAENFWQTMEEKTGQNVRMMAEEFLN